MDIKPRNSKSGPGVTRRQRRAYIGNFTTTRELKQQEVMAATEEKSTPPAQPFMLDTNDIDEVQQTAAKKVGFWQRLKPSHIRRNFTWGGFFKRLGLTVGVLGLLILGYFGYKLFFAVQNIIDRDSGGAYALEDDSGRVNILLIGIGGEKHQGGDLADTIIVASLDPVNKEVSMLSLPRDLWVDIPGQWATKINAAHALGEESGFSENGYPKDGPGLLQKTVEQTIGIPIHFYVRVDFNGFKQAIDSVGSIDVDVPEQVCDYLISWEFDFDCIEPGPQSFDSNKALFYARTRATARGDFDRGERQRLILVALQQKVLSAGTFSDPRKVLGLIETAGSHITTNLGLEEMLKLHELSSDVSSDKFVSAGIDKYVTTANINGASAVVPIDGNFNKIQRYVRSLFVDGNIKKEAAQIAVLNGTGVTDEGKSFASDLRSYGYNVSKEVVDAPSGNYTATRLYVLNDDSPFTKRYLEERLNTVALPGDDLPEGITSDAKFVIIVGADATR